MTKDPASREHRKAIQKRVFLALGVTLLAAMVGWQFGLAPRLVERLPRGWNWRSKLIGIATPPDGATGKFPRKDTTVLFEREVRLMDESRRPEAVTIEDRYTVIDHDTGQIVWENIYRAQIDPRTGAYAQADCRNDYYVFPRHTEPRAYVFRTNDARGIVLQFEREETLEDVFTYLFVYKGRADYGNAYDGSANYPGVKAAPGQEILCADEQFVYRLWVEPMSGEILKLEESCLSGDYLYDLATGKQIAPVLRWAGVTAGDTVVQRAGFIRGEKTRLILITRAVPAGLLLTGIFCLAVGLMWRQGRSHKRADLALSDMSLTVSGDLYKRGR